MIGTVSDTFMNNRRILFVSTLEAFAWGGSEELWSEAAAKLAADGCTVACCVSPAQAKGEKLRRLAEAGCEIRPRVASGEKLWTKAWNRVVPTARRRTTPSAFARALRDFRPDLVVISQGGNLCVNPYAAECREADVPYCCVVQSVPEAVYVPDDAVYPQLAESYAAARKVFFVSEGNRVALERQIACDLPNASRCYNPVNLKVTDEVPWPSGEDGALNLACVARAEFYAKGQDLILEVLARPRWRSRAVKVSFYGAGPNQKLLAELIAARKIQSATYRGFAADIREVWREHHALILPSRQEGLPLSLVEAALCGRPAIVTDVAGNTEVVVEGLTGFVAPAPTADEIDAALERAWEKRDLLPEMGRNARRRVLANFPSDAVAHFIDQIKKLSGVA